MILIKGYSVPQDFAWIENYKMGWSVGRWSVDFLKPRQNMFGVVNSPSHFDRGLFCYYNFNFFSTLTIINPLVPDVH